MHVKISKNNIRKLFLATDEISVSKMLFSKYLEYVPLILRNYKKLKRKKIVKFKISFILSAQYILVTTLE